MTTIRHALPCAGRTGYVGSDEDGGSLTDPTLPLVVDGQTPTTASTSTMTTTSSSTSHPPWCNDNDSDSVFLPSYSCYQLADLYGMCADPM